MARAARRAGTNPRTSGGRVKSQKKKQLGRGKRYATGIDIGAFSVKIVTLAGDDAGQIDIRKVTVMPLAPPENAEYAEEKLGRQRAALKEAVKRHGKIQGRAVLGFPRDLASVRYLTLPSTNPAELRDMILFDAERHVPFPVEDMEISHQLLEELGDHESRVMMAAVLTREIEPYVDMCREAGVDIQAIDLDVLGDCAAYARSLPEDETAAIVNFGRSSVKLSVVRGNQLLFSRSLPVTEERLLRGFRGAKTWRDLQGRVTAAGPLHPAEREHFSQWVEGLGMELMRSMSAFMCEAPGTSVGRMILCGGAGYFPAGPPRGLNLKLKTRITTEKALNGELPPGDQYNGSELVTAIGLALRGLAPPENAMNLLPERIVRERDQSQRSSFRKNVMIMGFMIFMLMGGGGYLKWYEKYLEHSRVDEFYQTLRTENAQVTAMAKKIAIVENYLDTRQSCVNVIEKVLEALPPQTYIAGMTFNKRNTFEIIGQVLSDGDVNKITEALINLTPGPGAEPYFDHVVPQTTAPKQIDLDSKKLQVYEFRIHCALRWEEGGRRAR